MKILATLALGTAITTFAGMAFADAQWGDYKGYTLRVKLIGGAQYEKLYAEIPKWEAATGAGYWAYCRWRHVATEVMGRGE